MATEGSGSSTKPNTQPRTSQACQRCRALKARCLPSNEPGVCQRCLNSKRDCVWPEIQQRTKLPRGPSRISQVEKKIDGLVARIANTSTSNHVWTPADSPAGARPRPGSNRNDEDEISSPTRSPTESHEHERDEPALSAASFNDIVDMHNFQSDSDDDSARAHNSVDKDVGSDDTLTKKLFAYPEMETLFEQYRSMAPSFPFVPIDDKMTGQTMCKRKPILLLAIIAAASWKNRKFQTSLEQMYRHEVGARAFARPRKDLALLQSILIYIAWYHYFADSKFSNAVMFQTALGLTVDLRLDPQAMPQLLAARDPKKRIRYGRDGQRALLGCYYLASTAASSLRIQNLFRYSKYMSECVKSFEKDTELESDRLIPHIINARYLDDHIFNFLHPGEYLSVLPSQEQVLSQLNIWEASANEWKQRVSSLGDSPLLNLPYHGIKMELYLSVFQHLCRGEQSNYLPALEMTKFNILHSCLEASRALLDALVAIPTEDFTLLPFAVWLRLPRTIITLAMITSPSEFHIPQWDIKAAQDRVRLDLFIETLCFRMQNISVFSPPSQPIPDFWSILKMVLQSIMKWYKRTVNRGTKVLTPASSTVQDEPQHETMRQQQNNMNVDFSDMYPTRSQPVGGFTYTPISMISNEFPLSDPSTYIQPPSNSAMCPMMQLNTNPDMDQFLQASFWSDGFGAFETINFDFTVGN